MDTSYIDRNQTETRRLRELVGRLSSADLEQSLGGGWTVKAALAHLAFWDRFAETLLDDWATNGFSAVPSSPDHINAAALHGWLELSAEWVLREVVAAAEAVDQRVAGLAPDLGEAIGAGGRGRMLDRTRHRMEHVQQITSALG